MNLTPLSEKMPSSLPTSSKNSTTSRPTTSPSHPPTRQFSTFHAPPLHLSKKSHPCPHSKYTSLPTVLGTTPRYPLAQLRPSFAWRTVTSTTQCALLCMASSPWSDTALPSLTNAYMKPDSASTNLPEQCTPTRLKYAASRTITGTQTCHQSTSKMAGKWTSKCPPTMAGKWTSKCPPTMARTSSLSGLESWGMAKSSPELESTSTSLNTWSPYFSHQTTHNDPPPPYPSGSSNCSKPREGPTTPWLKRPTASNTPPPSQRWNATANTINTTLNLKSIDEPSLPKSTEKMKPSKGSNTRWK